MIKIGIIIIKEYSTSWSMASRPQLIDNGALVYYNIFIIFIIIYNVL